MTRTILLCALVVTLTLVTAIYIHQEASTSTFDFDFSVQAQLENISKTSINNMTTYENQTLGIAFEYPAGWEVNDWDFSDLAEEELSVEPAGSGSLGLNPTPEEQQNFDALLKTDMQIQILDVKEILNPETFQLEAISVQDFCDGLRASLSDETLETGGFSEPHAYWLSNQIGREEITKVANQTACRIDSVELHDDVQEEFNFDVYLQKDGKEYMLTFSTDPASVPILAPVGQKMIESFRFLEN